MPGGERVAEVPAHGGQDHLGRPTVAGEGGSGKLGKVPAAASTGVALTAAAIVAVALGGRLLADQACRHRPPNLPAPHNFPDSPRGRCGVAGDTDLLTVADRPVGIEPPTHRRWLPTRNPLQNSGIRFGNAPANLIRRWKVDNTTHNRGVAGSKPAAATSTPLQFNARRFAVIHRFAQAPLVRYRVAAQARESQSSCRC